MSTFVHTPLQPHAPARARGAALALPIIMIAVGLLTGPHTSARSQSSPPGAAVTTPMAPAWTQGEVRRIDRAVGKVTVKHDEIKNLDMPPMTMVFQVKESALLDGLAPGGRIQFQAEKIAGAYVITALEAAR